MSSLSSDPAPGASSESFIPNAARRVLRVVAGISFCLAVALAPLLQAQVIGPIRKINPGLFTGTRADGIHFVMERIDAGNPGASKRLLFWRRYSRAEFAAEPRYKLAWSRLSPEQQARMPLNYRADESLAAGHQAFENSVDLYGTENELWVAYATPKEVQREDSAGTDDIEMYISIVTVSGAPMVMHMGIQRAFHYLIRAAETPGTPANAPHPGLALSLHSFAARVMLEELHPDLLYLVSSPTSEMRKRLLLALPKDAFLGSTYTRAKKQYAAQVLERPSDERRPLDAALAQAKIQLKTVQSQVEALKHEIAEAQRAPEPDAAGLAKQRHLLAELETSLRRAGAQEHKASFVLEERVRWEISHLAATLPVSLDDSPIAETKVPREIKIFSKDRRLIVFDWKRDAEPPTIAVGGQILAGEATHAYRWFSHPDLPFNPYLVANLDAVAKLSKAPEGAGQESKEEKKAD